MLISPGYFAKEYIEQLTSTSSPENLCWLWAKGSKGLSVTVRVPFESDTADAKLKSCARL
jgi:hypothetical protein